MFTIEIHPYRTSIALSFKNWLFAFISGDITYIYHVQKEITGMHMEISLYIGIMTWSTDWYQKKKKLQFNKNIEIDMQCLQALSKGWKH